MIRFLFAALLVVVFVTVNAKTATAQRNQTQPAIARNSASRTSRPVPVPRAPFPPLRREHQEYLDKVLKFWEHSSAQIKRYRCKFTRWQYDPVFGPRDAAKTIATGTVQYATPDKGLFEVKEVFDYKPPQAQGGKANFVKRKSGPDEKWICDGQSVFEFDYSNKRLIERQLPPEMRGKSIADGPLPFLFGAKAEKIKRRYWIRVITPKDAKDEYWLEAWPKFREDAANYKFVEVIISEKDFLPKAIQIFNTNYDPRVNKSRTAFTFENREVNWNTTLDNLNLFKRAFYRPALPANDWKKELVKYQGPQTANRAPRPANNR